VLPWPQLLGGHAFSATAAVLPAALGAALVVPSLASAPVSLAGTDVRAVLVAQAAPRVRSRPPVVEPMTRGEDAPAPAVPQSRPEQPGRNGSVHRAPAAQQQGEEGKPAAVTKYDFENDKVEGTLARPDGDGVLGDPVVKHASLIEIRREFVAEIGKMIEDL